MRDAGELEHRERQPHDRGQEHEQAQRDAATGGPCRGRRCGRRAGTQDRRPDESYESARRRSCLLTAVAPRRTLPVRFLGTSSCRRRASACPGREVASVLVALWSAKGGSGTSVFTAACALVLARDAHDADRPARRAHRRSRRRPARDLRARRRSRAGPGRLARRRSRGTHRRARPAARRGGPRGRAAAVGWPRPGRACPRPRPAPRSRSRSATAPCRRSSTAARHAIRRAGRWSRSPTRRVVVLRGCYLALRRAVHAPALAATAGAVLLEEPGRSLSARARWARCSTCRCSPGCRSSRSSPEPVDAGVLAAASPSRSPGRRPTSLRPDRLPHRSERRRARDALVGRARASPTDGDAELQQRVHRRLVAEGCRRRSPPPGDGRGPASSGRAAPRRAAAALRRALRRARSTSSPTRSPGSGRSSRCSPTRRSPR